MPDKKPTDTADESLRIFLEVCRSKRRLEPHSSPVHSEPVRGTHPQYTHLTASGEHRVPSSAVRWRVRREKSASS